MLVASIIVVQLTLHLQEKTRKDLKGPTYLTSPDEARAHPSLEKSKNTRFSKFAMTATLLSDVGHIGFAHCRARRE